MSPSSNTPDSNNLQQTRKSLITILIIWSRYVGGRRHWEQEARLYTRLVEHFLPLKMMQSRWPLSLEQIITIKGLSFFFLIYQCKFCVFMCPNSKYSLLFLIYYCNTWKYTQLWCSIRCRHHSKKDHQWPSKHTQHTQILQGDITCLWKGFKSPSTAPNENVRKTRYTRFILGHLQVSGRAFNLSSCHLTSLAWILTIHPSVIRAAFQGYIICR